MLNLHNIQLSQWRKKLIYKVLQVAKISSSSSNIDRYSTAGGWRGICTDIKLRDVICHGKPVKVVTVTRASSRVAKKLDNRPHLKNFTLFYKPTILTFRLSISAAKANTIKLKYYALLKSITESYGVY